MTLYIYVRQQQQRYFFCFASEQCKMKWKTFFKNYKPPRLFISFPFSLFPFPHADDDIGIWLWFDWVRLFCFAANLIHHAHELLFFVIPPDGGGWHGGEGRRGAWHGMAHSRRPVKVNWANVARQRVINHFFVVAFLCVWNLLVYKTEIQMRQPAACTLRPWTALSRLCIVFTAFSPVNLLPSLSVSLRSVCLPKWRHVSGSNWRVASTHTTYTHSHTPHTTHTLTHTLNWAHFYDVLAFMPSSAQPSSASKVRVCLGVRRKKALSKPGPGPGAGRHSMCCAAPLKCPGELRTGNNLARVASTWRPSSGSCSRKEPSGWAECVV